MTPGRLDLRVQRWVPFLYSIEVPGIDLSAATVLRAQVRLYRDAAGDALLDLTKQTAGTQGISVTSATVDGSPTSTIVIQIDEANLADLLPYPDSGVPAGSDVALVWDLVITCAPFGKRRWLEGSFTIVAGVTH